MIHTRLLCSFDACCAVWMIQIWCFHTGAAGSPAVLWPAYFAEFNLRRRADFWHQDFSEILPLLICLLLNVQAAEFRWAVFGGEEDAFRQSEHLMQSCPIGWVKLKGSVSDLGCLFVLLCTFIPTVTSKSNWDLAGSFMVKTCWRTMMELRAILAAGM